MDFLNSTYDIGPSNIDRGVKMIVMIDIAFSLIQHVTLGKISIKDM